MIDKKAREHEQPCHPENHENDVTRLEPEISHYKHLQHGFRL
jgi:hypothetical protein